MKQIFSFTLVCTALICMALSIVSCKDFLDEVSDRSLAVLTKVDEYQQLLDNTLMHSNAPGITDMGTDDIYILPNEWGAAYHVSRNAYVWAPDIYEGATTITATMDWRHPYEAVYYSNVVIDGMKDIKVNSEELVRYNDVLGQALFFRAFHHYVLQETFGHPFIPATAQQDLSIPLRLSSDVLVNVQRATVEQAFDLIIVDLQEAVRLLSMDYQVRIKSRPSKAAAHALLSRIYLTMQNYEYAKSHADTSLVLYNTLLNFNDLSPSNQLPFPDNIEVLFAVRQNAHLGGVNAAVSEELLQMFNPGDLRKDIYFQPHLQTNTSRINTLYSGNRIPFAGLAVDEVYLNRAECRVRLGDVEGALEDLNLILINRHIPSHYRPVAYDTPENVLNHVLQERRKQLVFRGVRWSDLRRLNQDSHTSKTITREINGITYSIPPNSNRYVYPIPLDEISLNNLVQNNRYD